MANQEISEVADCKLPKHVAIIMDGNGRWAEQRGKMRVFGHQQGVKSVRSAIAFAQESKLEALTLFAFSSENWRRPEQEVSKLMELFMYLLNREAAKLHKNNVQLRVIGDLSRFSQSLQKKIAKVEALTKDNSGLVLNVAANYGGRWDIANAAKKLAIDVAQGKLDPNDIDEHLLGNNICTHDLSDVDLMIRTGGDCRISNFLLWQLAYAELYFCDTLWPDFDDAAFCEAIAAFVSRERRFGCTGAQIKALVANK